MLILRGMTEESLMKLADAVHDIERRWLKKRSDGFEFIGVSDSGENLRLVFGKDSEKCEYIPLSELKDAFLAE